MKTISAAGQTFSSESPEELQRLVNLAYPGFIKRKIAESKMTLERCADLMGKERQTLSKSLDAKWVNLGFVRMLPDKVRKDVARDLLPEGCDVVELPAKATRGDCDYRFFARSFRTVTEAVSVSLEATSDGHVTRSEGAEIEALCDKAIGILLTIREVAKLAQREGVVGIRSAAKGGAA